jgi:hypothetical protein
MKAKQDEPDATKAKQDETEATEPPSPPPTEQQTREANAKRFFETFFEGNECTDVFNALRKSNHDDIMFIPPSRDSADSQESGDSQESTGSLAEVYLWYMLKDGFHYEGLWRALRATQTVAFDEDCGKTFVGFTWYGTAAYQVHAFQELVEAYLAQ